MIPTSPRDIVILVADKNIEAAVGGLLSRTESLCIRTVDAEILRHPQKDSGCCNEGVELLSSFANQFHHALLMFDHEGSGRDQDTFLDIENDIEQRLSQSGWNDRAKTIVIDPELEIWVWTNSPHLKDCFGWSDQTTPLMQWLLDRGYLNPGELKPKHPKEALEAVLRTSRTPRSSAIYRQLAERVSLRRCQDRAFLKFKDVMQQWFASVTDRLG